MELVCSTNNSIEDVNSGNMGILLMGSINLSESDKQIWMEIQEILDPKEEVRKLPEQEITKLTIDSCETLPEKCIPKDISSDNIEFKIVTEDMVEEAIEFLWENFYPDEPVRRSLEGGRGLLLDRFTKLYIGKGWSIAALDQTGKIIGLRVGKIVTPDDQFETAMAKESVKRVLCMISNITNAYNSLQTYFLRRERLGYSVLGFMEKNDAKRVYVGNGVCTASNYRGKGLATQLVAKSIEVAKNEGCDYVYVCVSGNYSSKLFDRLGFTVESELRYDEFVDESGQPLIKDTREHVKAQVRSKKI